MTLCYFGGSHMTPIRRCLGSLLLATTAFGASVHAQQGDTLTIKRAADLREAPNDSARSVASLALQSQVTRLGARQGPWIEVRTAQGASGWVHMFDAGVPPSAQGGNAASGALRGLTSLFGRGSAASTVTTPTATVGIRGLGAEDIANAQPNLDALARAEAMRQDAAQARLFGSTATLSAQVVQPLPVPPPPTRAAAPSGTGRPGAAPSGGAER